MYAEDLIALPEEKISPSVGHALYSHTTSLLLSQKASFKQSPIVWWQLPS